MLSESVKKVLISTFVLLHLTAVATSALPPSESAMRRQILGLFDPYLNGLALAQQWGMFAPHPPLDNFDVIATVTFRDGRVIQWVFPRMQDLGLVSRYQKERFRKWREYVRCDGSSVIWPDAAVWVARRCFADSRNPPLSVRLTRSWTEIPQPSGGLGRHVVSYPWAHIHSYVFFTYDLTDEDLK